MKMFIHLWLFMGAVAGLRAELPMPGPMGELLPTNMVPGIVVPPPTREGSSTSAVAGGKSATPKPQPVPTPDHGNRGWRMVSPTNATLDRITLRNDESLDGRVLGCQAGDVRWEHAAAARPIRFPGTGITSLKLAPPTNAPASAATGWLVRLANGNLLTGDGLTMNADTVELAASAAGRLRLPRTMVEAVQRNSVQGLTNFRALHWPGDWDRVSFGWQNREMNQQRWVYRDVGLPDCVGVELVVPAKMAPNRNLTLFLFSGHPTRLYGTPCYSVTLINNQLSIHNHGDNLGGGMPSQLQLPPAKARTTLTLGIRANRLTGRVVLLVDGEVKQTRQLVPLTEWSGRGILVADSRPDEPVPPWLLLTPLGEDLDMAVAKPDTDAVQFANGEAMEGRLESVGPTSLVLSGKLGRVELPAERLMLARLASPQRQEPSRREGDLAVTLRDGSRLTGVPQELGAATLVLENDLLGKIDLARALVAELHWGPYGSPKKPVPNLSWEIDYHRAALAAFWEAGTIDLAGDLRLRGALAGVGDGIVSWKHPHTIEPIQFRQSHVQRVTVLDSAAAALPAAATVKLTNCDRLSGELVAVDQRTVQLRPSYMPAVSLPRAMVATVRPQPAPDAVLDLAGSPTWSGTGKTKQITVTNNAVLFKQNAAGQLFLREAPLPSRLCLQFDLLDRVLNRHLVVNAFGRSQNGNHQESCAVEFRHNMIGLSAVGRNIPWPAVQGFYRADSARRSITATVLIDREQREMFVLIDRCLLAKWRGPRGQALPTGNQLGFIFHSGGPTQLRRLMLSEWRGSIESLTNPVPATVDSLLLHDMTRVSGTLTAVRDGQVYLAGKEGTSSQSLGQVNEIEFNQNNQEQPRQLAEDVRVYLLGGDQLTLSEARWDNTGLLGSSAALGPVAVPHTAIARIEFRLHNPPAQLAMPVYDGGQRQVTLDGCR